MNAMILVATLIAALVLKLHRLKHHLYKAGSVAQSVEGLTADPGVTSLNPNLAT